MQLLARWLVLALGVMLATKIMHPRITYDSASTLLVVVVLLSLFNAVLKPLLVLFTLPFIIVTLGIGVIVINALLFLFVGEIVKGFEVHGFWAALGGSLIVSITNLLLSSFTRGPKKPAEEKRVKKSDDVIDI